MLVIHLIIYGTVYPIQNENVKIKRKNTCLIKYGYEHPMQNPLIAEYAFRNSFRAKLYTFPSGRIDYIQGYEHFALDQLLNCENINETNIITSRTDVPEIWYNMSNNTHRYYVDIFIPEENKCIEVKSWWTFLQHQNVVFEKQKAAKAAGFLCEIRIYSKKGKLLKSFN